MAIPQPIDVLGVPVHPLTKTMLVDLLAEWASGDDNKLVCHVNAHGMNLAHRDPRFRSVLNAADVTFCDGHGVIWAARMLGRVIPERLAVMDWIDDFAAKLAGGGSSIFLLGDEEGVAETCAKMLEDKHPGLRVAGWHHGFFAGDGEDREVLEKINASGAQVVLVGMGMPLQELWISDKRDALEARLVVPVGATFRWYAGVERRPPAWMAEHGLEWLGRLARHPIRMFRRYVIGNPAFALRVLSARRRLNGANGERRR